MGGYSSFPICFAAALLKIKFLIYENNLIIGKANQYLLPYDNIQNDANHVHSVVRDLSNDWGESILKIHYSAQHNVN